MVSCELQEEAIHQHEHNSNLKLYELKLEELMTNKKFVNSFSKLPKSKKSIANATFGRTVMEDEYGFTIANKPAKVIENNGETSYTFLITRDSTNLHSFENLVIQTDSLNNTKALIIKYNLTSDILASDHGSSEFQATKEITQIVYNNQPSTTGKELFEDPCTTIHTIICCQSWSGGAGSCHVAQEVCLTTNAGTKYLSVNSETICEESTGGDSPGDTGTSSDGVSTNGGGATTTTTSSNYDGSDTSIHGNGSNSVNTAPVAPEVDQMDDDPCTSLNKNTTNKTAYMTNFNSLNDPLAYDYPYETGFAMRTYPSGSRYYGFLSPSSEGTSLKIPDGCLNYTHIHNNQLQTINGNSIDHAVKMFSAADLYALLTKCQVACTNNGASASDAFGVMISNEGIFAISLLGPYAHAVDFNVKWQKFLDNYKRETERILFDPLLNAEQRKKELEKMFLQELKALGLEDKVGFFEGTVTTEAGIKKLNWTRKTLNSDTVTPNPC